MLVTCASIMPEAFAPTARSASSTMTSRHMPHPSSRICQAVAHLLPCQSVRTVGVYCAPAVSHCMLAACPQGMGLVGFLAGLSRSQVNCKHLTALLGSIYSCLDFTESISVDMRPAAPCNMGGCACVRTLNTSSFSKFIPTILILSCDIITAPWQASHAVGLVLMDHQMRWHSST